MNIKTNKIRASRPDSPYSGHGSMIAVSRVLTVLLALTVLYPIVFIVLVSFKSNQEFYANVWGLPNPWRWSNYAFAWVERGIGGFARNSVIVSLSGVAASVVLTALGGYALSKMYIPRAEVILAVLMTFNFVPGVAIYISLYIQMISMNLNKTLLMLILPYMTWQIPFSLYIFKKFFDSVPTELLEAARIDGSGEIYTFFRIIIPLVRPAIATVMVFNFINIWGEYMWAGIASSSTVTIQTLPVGLLRFRGEYGVEWGPFAAGILIIVLPLMLIFVYLQRYFIQGLTSGAVKG